MWEMNKKTEEWLKKILKYALPIAIGLLAFMLIFFVYLYFSVPHNLPPAGNVTMITMVPTVLP